jgi:hypothetical protein
MRPSITYLKGATRSTSCRCHSIVNHTRHSSQITSSDKDDKGTDAEVRAAYEGYVAYFGTYRVDEANSVVTHVVEGSLNPGYTGTDQPRPFTLHLAGRLIQQNQE